MAIRLVHIFVDLLLNYFWKHRFHILNTYFNMPPLSQCLYALRIKEYRKLCLHNVNKPCRYGTKTHSKLTITCIAFCKGKTNNSLVLITVSQMN